MEEKIKHCLEQLTPRQKECLRYVGKGYSSKEIGKLLGISHETVNSHISITLNLLGQHSRGKAARMLVDFEANHKSTSQSDYLVTANLKSNSNQAIDVRNQKNLKHRLYVLNLYRLRGVGRKDGGYETIVGKISGIFQIMLLSSFAFLTATLLLLGGYYVLSL